MKKITALLLALAVVVSFGTAAFATEGENEFNEIIGAGTETAEKTADILKDVAYLNDDNVLRFTVAATLEATKKSTRIMPFFMQRTAIL